MLGESASALDRGALAGSGWWDHANLLGLRMLSFNSDRAASAQRYEEAGSENDRDSSKSSGGYGVKGGNSSPSATPALPTTVSEQERCCLPPRHYSASAYAAYLCYAPLYVAGPVLTANAFLCQQQSLALPLITAAAATSECAKDGGGGDKGDNKGEGKASTAVEDEQTVATLTSRRHVAAYAARWALALFMLEALSSRAPCYAMSHARLTSDLEPAHALAYSYLSIKLVWLKFVVIWRFFRLWALLDGRCPHENLPRPMSSHYSGLTFWRSWHASFNRWLLRCAPRLSPSLSDACRTLPHFTWRPYSLVSWARSLC